MSHDATPLFATSGLTVEIPGALGERGIGLRRISLAVAPGEIVVLAGESGSGKSLLARIAAGTADPRMKVLAGSIEFEGVSVLEKKRRRLLALRRGSITVIAPLATAPPDPDRSVRQWLRDCRRFAGKGGRLWGDCFFSAGLHEPEPLLRQRLGDLSPLTLKRLAVARALIVGSRFIISEDAGLDLDALGEAAFHELLGRVRDEFGIGALVSMGSLRGVERFANRVAIFFEGGILEEGTPLDLLTNPRFAYTREFRVCEPGLTGLPRDLPTISREAAREAEAHVHQTSSSLDGAFTG
ncbi:MAG: ATP-binding cassette domain-containing protein [Verrucomicrobiales bacterium]|nr:ATP-binding cassette domain-containing protein [Verrucomicrobiales bacterium]